VVLAVVGVAALVFSAAGCGPHYYAPAYQAYPAPPPASTAPREPRQFDRGYQEGYRAGYMHRGGGDAPDWMTARMYPDDVRQFRHGYHDGYKRGRYDQKHGIAPAYRVY